MQVKILLSAFIGLIQLSNALPTGIFYLRCFSKDAFANTKLGEVEGRWLLIGGATCAPKCIEGTEATS